MERVVEMVRHASARDVGFFVGGAAAVLLLALLACVALALLRRWRLRRLYQRSIGDEKEAINSSPDLDSQL